jgi:serine/threonine-protein phosphatase CPPED1
MDYMQKAKSNNNPGIEKKISRRAFLGEALALGAAATLPLLPGCRSTPGKTSLAGKHPSEPFFFIQMADPQFGFEAALAKEEDGGFETETRLFEQAIALSNQLRPAFVVVCGDIVNTSENREQTREAKRIAAMLHPDIPLYWVAGNHEVWNNPTPRSLKWYREQFGPDWYSFTKNGRTFIVLNSCLFYDSSRAPGEAAAQDAWMQKALAQAHRPVIFMHHPVCLVDPREEDGYFQLPARVRLPLINLFQDHGVEAVFNGHYHRNAYVKVGQMELVTSGPVGIPLGEDPSGFRIVKVMPSGLEHQYYGFESVPGKILL